MPAVNPGLRPPRRAREGSAAVEFAIVAPLFLMMVCVTLVYGSWFLLAHSVQALATEAAKASIGGLDVAERRSLAIAYLDANKSSAGLWGAHPVQRVDVSETETRVVIQVDTVDHPIRALSQLVPSPSALIERTAIVVSRRP